MHIRQLIFFFCVLLCSRGYAENPNLLSASDFFEFLKPFDSERRGWEIRKRYDLLFPEYDRGQIDAFFDSLVLLTSNDFEVVELSVCFDVLIRNQLDHPAEQTLKRTLEISDQSVELLSSKDQCWGIYRLFCLSEALPEQEQALSEQIFKEAVKLAKSSQCYDMYLVGLRSQARRFFSLGNLSKSLFYSYMGIRVADSASFKVSNFRRAEMHNEMGRLHYHMKNYPISLKRFKTAAANYEISEVETNEIKSIYNSIALCFRGMEQYDSALFYFEKSLALVKAANDKDWIGIVQGNIGDVHYFRKEYAKALPYLWTDIHNSTLYNVPESAVLSGARLGKVYLELQQLDSATYYLENAYRLFDNNQLMAFKNRNPKHFFEIQIEVLSGLSSLEIAKKEFEKAASYLQRLNRQRDSIQAFEAEQNIAWLEADLLMEDQSQEALLLEAELAEQKSYLQLIVIAATALFVVLVLTVFVLIQRAKINRIRQAQLRAENNEKLEKLHRIEVEHQAQTEIIQLEQENMQLEIDRKNRELLSMTQEVAHKNGLVRQLNDMVELTESNEQLNRADLKDIKAVLRNSIQTEKDFEIFRFRFEEVHPLFFQLLNERYPQLTPHDLQLCAYLKMGLANNEIASIMNITAASLKNARYRLKKKMALENEEGLLAVLNALV